MTFFNKKQDVIDFQLTSEGRLQLSKGTFKPVFYEFYDDGIIYDLAYVSASEAQNDAQDRIQKHTPTFKGNSRFTGSSNQSLTKFNEYGNKSLADDSPDFFLYGNPYFTALGTFDSNQQTAPYFQLKILNQKSSSLSASVPQAAPTAPAQIPQLNITCSYKYWWDEKSQLAYFLEDPVVLSLEEKNVIYENFTNNFEVQIFEVLKQPIYDKDKKVIGSKEVLKQPKKFILPDKTRALTPSERTEQTIEILNLYEEVDNLVFEQLDILLDEVFTNEDGVKYNSNAGLFIGVPGVGEVGDVGGKGGKGGSDSGDGLGNPSNKKCE